MAWYWYVVAGIVLLAIGFGLGVIYGEEIMWRIGAPGSKGTTR